MKIRKGFVSNSSSSSFLICLPWKLTKKTLIQSVPDGIESYRGYDIHTDKEGNYIPAKIYSREEVAKEFFKRAREITLEEAREILEKEKIIDEKGISKYLKDDPNSIHFIQNKPDEQLLHFYIWGASDDDPEGSDYEGHIFPYLADFTFSHH